MCRGLAACEGHAGKGLRHHIQNVGFQPGHWCSQSSKLETAVFLPGNPDESTKNSMELPYWHSTCCSKATSGESHLVIPSLQPAHFQSSAGKAGWWRIQDTASLAGSLRNVKRAITSAVRAQAATAPTSGSAVRSKNGLQIRIMIPPATI